MAFLASQRHFVLDRENAALALDIVLSCVNCKEHCVLVLWIDVSKRIIEICYPKYSLNFNYLTSLLSKRADNMKTENSRPVG